MKHTNSILPRVLGIQRCQISIPVGYKTVQDGRLGIVGL